MKETSLQDITRQIGKRLDTLQEGRPFKLEFLSAIEAFMAVDPLLSSLYKQYKDALAYSRNLAARRGTEDPMAVVAADMADSAESAFKTRLIEVRRDRKLRREALLLLRRTRKKQRQNRHSVFHKRRREIAAFRQGSRVALEEAQQKGKDSFMAVLLQLSLLQQTLARSQKMLKLATAFEAASVAHGYKTV